VPIPRTALAAALLAALTIAAPSHDLRGQSSAPTASSSATPSSGDTPEAVGRQYAQAMRAGDWSKAAGLMHPEALRKLRALMAPIAEADSSGEVARTLFQVQSARELATLSDAELFTRLFAFLMTRSPELKESLGGADMTMIGHVAEGPDVVHVVYRFRMPVRGITVEKIETMSMRRNGESWRVLLTGDIEGLAAALRARAGGA
jgi:hypothetical protein